MSIVQNDQLFIVQGLRPDTQYEIRLALIYDHSNTYLAAPKKNRYSTLGSIPGPPSNPHFDPADNVTELHWSPPSANGHEVLLYRIQYRFRGGIWKDLTTVDGIITVYKLDILVNDTYEFQIAAINRQGQGPYQLFGGLAGSGSSFPMWVIAVIVIVVVLIAIVAVLFFGKFTQYYHNNNSIIYYII